MLFSATAPALIEATAKITQDKPLIKQTITNGSVSSEVIKSASPLSNSFKKWLTIGLLSGLALGGIDYNWNDTRLLRNGTYFATLCIIGKMDSSGINEFVNNTLDQSTLPPIDIYRIFLRLSSPNTLPLSLYRPTSITNDSDVQYYSIKNWSSIRSLSEKQTNGGYHWSTKLLQSLLSIKPGEIIDNGYKESFDYSMQEKYLTNITLGMYLMSFGKDEKGPYMSIYDIYDYGHSSRYSLRILWVFSTLLDHIGKPIHFYDRYYIPTKEIKEELKRRQSENDPVVLPTANQFFDPGMKRLARVIASDLKDRGYHMNDIREVFKEGKVMKYTLKTLGNIGQTCKIMPFIEETAKAIGVQVPDKNNWKIFIQEVLKQTQIAGQINSLNKGIPKVGQRIALSQDQGERARYEKQLVRMRERREGLQLAQQLKNQSPQSASSATEAAVNPGGIDLNPQALELETRGKSIDNFASSPISFDPANFQGFSFQILGFEPIPDLSLLLTTDH